MTRSKIRKAEIWYLEAPSCVKKLRLAESTPKTKVRPKFFADYFQNVRFRKSETKLGGAFNFITILLY